jgi:hypothetical protein
MGVDDRLKDLRGTSRRDFLRWTATVAAAMGLERARYLNVLNDTAGYAMAQAASCASTMRSVHLIGGNGGLANFQLLWPQVEIAMGNNQNYAFHALGQAQQVQGTDKPLVNAPESPFKTLGPKRQISAFMAGNNETHTGTPQSAATIGTGMSMLGAVAAIQMANPTLLPVIGVNPLNFGTAPGAPAIATVANAGGLVDLFNSAASRTLLTTPDAADLHERYYKAFLGLNRAAGRQTMVKSYNVGKVAANLLGRNLADQLRPTAADDQRYGINAGTATKFVEIARGMMTALKAFRLGLTSMVVLPAMRDDPHGLFGNGNQEAARVALTLGRIFDAFMAEASTIPDPACSGKTLGDTIVMTVHGDTPKTPLNRGGWPDGTPGNSNWMYVFGNGYLKTGWFGRVTTGNQAITFDPVTGNDAPGQPTSSTSNAAAAAVAYAVAKGDMRRVQDFYRGASINGIINPVQL